MPTCGSNPCAATRGNRNFLTAPIAARRQSRRCGFTRHLRCARVFFGFSRCVKSVLWQQALRASPLCHAVSRLRVAVRLCSNVLRAYSSFLQVHRVRSRARAPGLREVRRPNSSFKPTPLHGRDFFRYVAFSGRGRAAVRLNSGVRPLKSLHPAFHAHLRFKSLCGNSWESQLPDRACGVSAAISQLNRHAAMSVRPRVLWLLAVRQLGFVAAGTSCIAALPLPFPAFVWQCARAATFSALTAASCRLIGCAHAPRHLRFARLGGLTVRSSRHRFTAANFFGMLRSLVAAVQRCGLTQVLAVIHTTGEP